MTDIGKFTEPKNINGTLVTIGIMTFWIRSSEKWQFGFNHWNPVLKTEFFEKDSCLLALTTSTNQMQSFFKTDLSLINYLKFNFYV